MRRRRDSLEANAISFLKKPSAGVCRPQAANKFQSFFPRHVLRFCNDPIEGSCKIKFCTATRCGRAESWEKLFARSERRIVRQRRTTEAQSEAETPSQKWRSHFWDTKPRAPGVWPGALGLEKREGEKREFIAEQRHDNIGETKSQPPRNTIHEMFTAGSKTIQNPILTSVKIWRIVSVLKLSIRTIQKERGNEHG